MWRCNYRKQTHQLVATKIWFQISRSVVGIIIKTHGVRYPFVGPRLDFWSSASPGNDHSFLGRKGLGLNEIIEPLLKRLVFVFVYFDDHTGTCTYTFIRTHTSLTQMHTHTPHWHKCTYTLTHKQRLFKKVRINQTFFPLFTHSFEQRCAKTIISTFI